jgi:hypothetical protein
MPQQQPMPPQQSKCPLRKVFFWAEGLHSFSILDSSILAGNISMASSSINFKLLVSEQNGFW